MAVDPPDRGVRLGDDRQRIRKLAQAALNADQTVGQVESLLADMGPLLAGLTTTTDSLDTTIATMDATLSKVDSTVEAMAGVVSRLEAVTSRVERVVLVMEVAIAPLGAVESAGRAIAGRLGILGRR